MRRSTTKWLIAVIALVLVFGAVVPTMAQASGGGTTLISGKDGKDGQDGADGITPILRINEETGEWEYSYTGGRYWTSMGVKAGSSYDADNLLNPEYINQAWYANFGDKGGGAVIWEEKTLKFTSADNYFGLNNQKFNLTVGIEVDVVWNGTVYTCIPFEQSGEIFLGNRELMVPGGSHAAVYNVPFCFTGMRDTFNMVKKSTDTAENITVKIVTHVYDTYNKLDVGYLPDEVVTTDELPALGGGTSLDVTAQPGQTIIVKEVDENGKPIKWESADYQPRTHWSDYEEAVLIDNQSYGEYDEVFLDFALVEGQSYHIVFNGVEYDEVARSGNADGMVYVALGDGEMFGEESTGEPYTFIYMEGQGTMPMTNGGGDYTVSLSAVQETVHKMPDKYMPEFRPYTFLIFEDGDGYLTSASVETVETAFLSGREIKGVIYRSADDITLPLFLVAYSKGGNETEYGKVLVLRDLYISGLTFTLTPQEDGTYSVTILGK